MLVPFADKEARDHGAPRLHQLLDEGEERAFDEFLGGKSRDFDLTADRAEGRRVDALHHRFEQFDLGLEVEIGEAFAHARTRGDILKPRARVAMLRKFLEGRGDDLLRPRVSSLAPFDDSLGRFPTLRGLCLSHGYCLPPCVRPRPIKPLRLGASGFLLNNILTDRSVLQYLGTRGEWARCALSPPSPTF